MLSSIRIKIAKSFVFVFCFCTLSSAQQAPALKDVISTLSAGKSFEQAAISPDGQQVAWVQEGKIYVSGLGGNTAPRHITAGKAEDEGAVAWSPDSKRIAFLSDAGTTGRQQLYVMDIANGRPRKLTSVKGSLSSPGWSPDG